MNYIEPIDSSHTQLVNSSRSLLSRNIGHGMYFSKNFLQHKELYNLLQMYCFDDKSIMFFLFVVFPFCKGGAPRRGGGRRRRWRRRRRRRWLRLVLSSHDSDRLWVGGYCIIVHESACLVGYLWIFVLPLEPPSFCCCIKFPFWSRNWHMYTSNLVWMKVDNYSTELLLIASNVIQKLESFIWQGIGFIFKKVWPFCH